MQYVDITQYDWPTTNKGILQQDTVHMGHVLGKLLIFMSQNSEQSLVASQQCVAQEKTKALTLHTRIAHVK